MVIAFYPSINKFYTITINIMKEIWKDVVWYENYEVSNIGNVRAKERKSFMHWIYEYKLKPMKLKKQIWDVWYYVVWLTKNSVRNSIRIHRLVAEAFIPNPKNKKYVNHIDWNKLNNNVNNLEWCTAKENIEHAINVLWVNYSSWLWIFWKDNPTSKITYQYTKDWLLLKEWECVRQIERELWFSNQNISKCCLWHIPSAYWYVRKH